MPGFLFSMLCLFLSISIVLWFLAEKAIKSQFSIQKIQKRDSAALFSVVVTGLLLIIYFVLASDAIGEIFARMLIFTVGALPILYLFFYVLFKFARRVDGMVRKMLARRPIDLEQNSQRPDQGTENQGNDGNYREDQ